MYLESADLVVLDVAWLVGVVRDLHTGKQEAGINVQCVPWETRVWANHNLMELGQCHQVSQDKVSATDIYNSYHRLEM